MKKYIYNLIILIIGFFILSIAVADLYVGIMLIATGTTSSILFGILLIIVSILIGGIGGILIDESKMLD